MAWAESDIGSEGDEGCEAENEKAFVHSFYYCSLVYFEMLFYIIIAIVKRLNSHIFILRIFFMAVASQNPAKPFFTHSVFFIDFTEPKLTE